MALVTGVQAINTGVINLIIKGMSTAWKLASTPVPLKNLSPEKFGRSAFRELSYTPEKLVETILYKDVASNKKLELEKKRIRELESEVAVQGEKVRQLELEVDTVRKSLTMQIDMYKKMLKDKEEEHARLIKSQQGSYNAEIRRLLEEQDRQTKVFQSEKDSLETRICQLLSRITELESHSESTASANASLSTGLATAGQTLKNTQEKLLKAEELARLNHERADSEIGSLNRQLEKERGAFKQQLENVLNEKGRELEGLRKLHQAEVDKLENKHQMELGSRDLQLKELKQLFEAEGRRLDEILAQKDRANHELSGDLGSQKDHNAALAQKYEMEVCGLLQTKEMLLGEVDRVSQERNHLLARCQQLELGLTKTHSQSEQVIRNLEVELSKTNAELMAENQRLVSTVQSYESERSYLKSQQAQKQADSTRYKMTTDQLAEENRHLLKEVQNLREVLRESSVEMQRCKEEFLRIEREKDRLLRASREWEVDSARMKQILAERDMEARQWRDTYVALKSRY